MSEEEAQTMQRKLRTGSLDLEDFLHQVQRVREMGPLSQVLEMIPGLGAARRQLAAEAIDESQITKMEAIIRSMTPQERHNPQIIDGSRRRRIARGSGTTPQDINQLLNQWRQAKKLIGSMSSRDDLARLFR